MERHSTIKGLGRLEKLLLLFGLLLLSVYAIARIYGLASSRLAVHRFLQARDTSEKWQPAPGSGPDFQLWSPQRVAAYKSTLESNAPAVLAVLRIPALHLDVPIFEGTDEFVLNRGVGHIDGTAQPTQEGNVGIAGHRDGFFRVLKDIQQGDSIELLTQKRTDRYVVDELVIVSPEDVTVLAPRAAPSLTLVTCYPFYFVGSAPQRFIVHATVSNSVNHQNSGQQESSAGKGGG